MTTLEYIFNKIKDNNMGKNLKISLENNINCEDLSIAVFVDDPTKIEQVNFQNKNKEYFIYYSTFSILNAKKTFFNYGNFESYFSKPPLKNLKKKIQKELKKIPPPGYQVALFIKEKIKEKDIEEIAYFFIKIFKMKIDNDG